MHCPLFFALLLLSVLLQCSNGFQVHELFTDIDPGSFLGPAKSTYCQASKPDNQTYRTPVSVPDVYRIAHCDFVGCEGNRVEASGCYCASWRPDTVRLIRLQT
jgi:hypothetical protein